MAAIPAVSDKPCNTELVRARSRGSFHGQLTTTKPRRTRLVPAFIRVPQSALTQIV